MCVTASETLLRSFDGIAGAWARKSFVFGASKYNVPLVVTRRGTGDISSTVSSRLTAPAGCFPLFFSARDYVVYVVCELCIFLLLV